MRRATYLKLRAAIRHLAPKPGRVYVDTDSGSAFIFTKRPLSRAWGIAKISASDVNELTSALNTGEKFGLLHTTRYALGRGVLRRSSSTAAFTQAPDEDEPQPVDLGPARTGRRDAQFEARVVDLDVPDDEALTLADQIARATLPDGM